MKKILIIIFIFIFIAVAVIAISLYLDSDYRKYADFRDGCRKEGAEYLYCDSTPICRYSETKIGVPSVGYGETFRVGGGWLNNLKIDKSALEKALARFQETNTPMKITKNCAEKLNAMQKQK